jgi:hypothetical protein
MSVHTGSRKSAGAALYLEAGVPPLLAAAKVSPGQKKRGCALVRSALLSSRPASRCCSTIARLRTPRRLHLRKRAHPRPSTPAAQQVHTSQHQPTAAQRSSNRLRNNLQLAAVRCVSLCTTCSRLQRCRRSVGELVVARPLIAPAICAARRNPIAQPRPKRRLPRHLFATGN